MRSSPGVLVLAVLLAGAVGAVAARWLAPATPQAVVAAPPARVDLGTLERRLDRIEERLASREEGRPSTGGMPAKVSEPGPAAPPVSAAPGTAPKKEAPATMEEVRAYLALKLKEDRDDGERRFQVSVGDAGTLSLKDVAAALGIEDSKVSRIRELYQQEGEEQLKAVFGTDDIDSIRRRIRDAQEDPTRKARLQETLLANLMTSLPAIRRAETAKEAALKDLLGPATYDKFRTKPIDEGETDEFDALLGDVLGPGQKKAGGEEK